LSGTIGTCISFFEKKLDTGLVNANESTTNLVKTTLKKTNTPVNLIKIAPFPILGRGNMAVFGRQNIILDKETENDINQALEFQDQLSLAKYSAILEHEASHIRNYDMPWRAATALTIPFITHKVTKATRDLLPYAKKAKPFLLEQCIKIPTGFGKLALSLGALTGIARYQEQRADNEVTNDINTLIGLKKAFTELSLEEKRTMATLSPLRRKYITLFPTHPPLEKRIQKIDQRIALLEKAEKNESDKS
jgi:hypothetical protein